MGICQVIQYYTPPTTGGGGLICKKNKSLNKNVYAQPGFYFFFTTIIITKMQNTNSLDKSSGARARACSVGDRRGHEWASQAMAQEVGPLDVFSLPF